MSVMGRHSGASRQAQPRAAEGERYRAAVVALRTLLASIDEHFWAEWAGICVEEWDARRECRRALLREEMGGPPRSLRVGIDRGHRVPPHLVPWAGEAAAALLESVTRLAGSSAAGRAGRAGSRTACPMPRKTAWRARSRGRSPGQGDPKT
jgi:hypothetical protein